jgi:rhamnosyltransferase
MEEKKVKWRVAVLCATRNGELWIAEQVESILSQIGVLVEIFFSDDQSTDLTTDWLKTKSMFDDRIHLLPSFERFGSASMNFFRLVRDVNFDRFDYVALADQDDIWALKKLLNAINILQIKLGEGYSSNLIAFDNNKNYSWYLKKSYDKKKFDYLFQGASAGCTYVLTKKAAQLVKTRLVLNEQYWHSKLSHDWLIYAICRSHGLTWVQDRDAHIFYRQHGINAYGGLPGFRGLIERAKAMYSGWYRNHVLDLKKFQLGSQLDEKIVLSAVERYSFKDRIWLVFNASKFRRTKGDVFLLRISFILGLF